MSSSLTVDGVRAMIGAGRTDTEIGEHFGLDRRTVQTFRAKHGIKASGPVGKNRHAKTLAAEVPTQHSPMSIAEFLLNKKRAVCPICRLRPEVAALVTKARKDGERGADIIEYLQVVHKVKVDPADFARHISQRHTL